MIGDNPPGQILDISSNKSNSDLLVALEEKSGNLSHPRNSIPIPVGIFLAKVVWRAASLAANNVRTCLTLKAFTLTSELCSCCRLRL